MYVRACVRVCINTYISERETQRVTVRARNWRVLLHLRQLSPPPTSLLPESTPETAGNLESYRKGPSE
jgi:hypothetical protein